MPFQLKDALDILETLAPLHLAAEWDNVGLLIEPAAGTAPAVERVFLTIDLTEPVLGEAIEGGCDLIVAYHPPIFSGLKRLRQREPAERVVLEVVSAGIIVYSPHTALDAAPGGLNDWLASVVGGGGVEAVTESVEIAPDAPPPRQLARRVRLKEPAPLATVVAGIKQRLGLSHVRVAESERHAAGTPIASAAVCAGAGGSLLEQVTDVDLLLTGEMRHHDVRAHVAAGRSVVLTDHTNTERGYLPILAERLVAASGGQLQVTVSSKDRDPLEVT